MGDIQRPRFEGASTPQESKPGRAPATTHGELSHVALGLFLERGFAETTIDDIVREAGIGRRTFFRYFSSKNELPWGNFSALLETMRERFEESNDAVPLMEALREVILDFNDFPEDEMPYHRGRMWLLLNVPALNAYSMLKYASWRAVVAEFIARRLGERPEDVAPQAIAWACLGICVGAYEQWLAHENADLRTLLEASFRSAESAFGIRQT